MTRARWMALLFALGSTCFFVGPFPGYVKLVGGSADAVTFFVGSILFTAGGAMQSWITWDHRTADRAGRAAWWSAVIQSAGTLFFNVTTFMALETAVSNSNYDRLVWRPDAFGSICFLVSGVIAYVASPRHGWWPTREEPRMVATGSQPARLHLLRHLGDCRLRRPVDRLNARSGCRELEHMSRRGLLLGVRPRHVAQRSNIEGVARPGVAQARADRGTRRSTGDLRCPSRRPS